MAGKIWEEQEKATATAILATGNTTKEIVAAVGCSGQAVACLKRAIAGAADHIVPTPSAG